MTTPLFPLLPNSKSPIVERLEWLTDVSIALDGTETRTRLRPYPHYVYRAAFSMFDAEARAVLGTLRVGDKVQVPLFPHVRIPGERFDAGICAPNIITPAPVLLSQSGSIIAGTAIPNSVVPDTATWLCPYAEAWPSADRELDHLTTIAAAAQQLEFQIENYSEFFPTPYYTSGNTIPDLGALGGIDWTNGVREKIKAEADIADYGHLRIQQQRYTKRTLTLTIALTSRVSIAAFRQFLFRVAGRAYAFKFQFGADATDATKAYWRLDTDSVEIQYLTKNYATCQLDITQLDNTDATLSSTFKPFFY